MTHYSHLPGRTARLPRPDPFGRRLELVNVHSLDVAICPAAGNVIVSLTTMCFDVDGLIETFD